MNTKFNDTQNNVQEEESINLKQIIQDYLSYWKWFVLSVILALIGGVFYLKYTQKQYQVTAKILLNDKDKVSGELAALTENTPFLSNTNSEVGDQIEVLKSRRLITKVVTYNNLNISYFNKGKIAEFEIAEAEAPIKLMTLSEIEKPKSLQIKVLSLTQFQISEGGTSSKFNFGQKFKLNGTEYVVSSNHAEIQKSIGKSILVKVNSIENAVSKFVAQIKISPNGEKTSKIINFAQVNQAPKIAELFINQLILQYNKDLVEDNSRLTKATSIFIENRLDTVAHNLKKVDSNLQNFKVRNDLTDIASEADLFLKGASESEKKILDINNQLQLVEYMSGALASNKGDLLPSNIGLQDATIAAQINSYNQLVLTKEDMLKSITPEHPNVINVNAQIAEIKGNLKNSLRLYKNNTQTTLNSIRGQYGNIKNRISKIPQQETGFRDISREQKIVESLYLFLLEKREENEIKAASKPEHIKIIDEAYISKVPVSPKSNIIILGAIIIGLIIPFAIIYVYNLLYDKFESKKDIEHIIEVPLAVQIPSSKSKIIQTNDNSSLAEGFRMLRTNIKFLMNNNENRGKVIFVTSTVSGEGKTFVASNLSKIYGFSSEKVLLIGADIRKPKIAEFLEIEHLVPPGIGLTKYLADHSTTIQDIIVKNPNNIGFDFINAGVVPPNPAELLLNKRFEEVMSSVKEMYDYIIVDTAPIALVSDTISIAENADLTLYVARANFTEKDALNLPNQVAKNNVLNNVSIVINDVDFSKSNSYAYGYGAGYVEIEHKSITKRLLHKFMQFMNG